MKKKKEAMVLCLAALKPRNPLVSLARKRSAGAHTGARRHKARQEKDLVQRLREAGL